MERMFPWVGGQGQIVANLLAALLNSVHLFVYAAVVALAFKVVV